MSAWEATVTVQDEKGKKATHRVYVPYSSYNTFSAALAFFQDYLSKITPLLGGVVTTVNVNRSAAIPVSLRHDPDVEADVEEGLRVQLNTAEARQRLTFTVATWKDIFLNLPFALDGKRRPGFDPEVTAFRNILTVAPTLGHAANPCNARGARVTSSKDMYQVFKKS